jgi:hypothetical protein
MSVYGSEVCTPVHCAWHTVIKDKGLRRDGTPRRRGWRVGDVIRQARPNTEGITVGHLHPASSRAGISSFDQDLGTRNITNHQQHTLQRHENRAVVVHTRDPALTMQSRTKVRRRVLACARCRKRKLSVPL